MKVSPIFCAFLNGHAMKKACISMRFGRENSAADIDSEYSSYGIWIPFSKAYILAKPPKDGAAKPNGSNAFPTEKV